MKRLILAALVSLAPEAALAAPTLLPSRDVSVGYTLGVPGQSQQTFQFIYNAAAQRARITSANGYYVLANLPAGQAQLIVPALHAVVQAPDFSALTAEFYQAEANAKFTALGQGHYAGLDCENYQVIDDHGSAQACLTPDGVILHFNGHDSQGEVTATATTVNYGPQPLAQFSVPAGLTPLNLPASALKALLESQ